MVRIGIYVLFLHIVILPGKLFSQFTADSLSTILESDNQLEITFGCGYDKITYPIFFDRNPFLEVVEELRKDSIISLQNEQVAITIVIYENVPFVENVRYLGKRPKTEWILKKVFHNTVLTMDNSRDDLCQNQKLKRSVLVFRL